MSERFQQYLEEIRAKVDLYELVKSHGCKLRKTGSGQWKGLSPLRQEKTPSFYVYEAGSWYDFGTGDGGDVFTYMMKREGCDFKAAAALLGDYAGLERYWDTEGFGDKDKYLAEVLARTEMHTTYSILTEAMLWYADRLPDFAREIYHTTYGLTDETIDELKLGWGFLGLWEYLRETQHYSEEACLRTGLFVPHSKGISEIYANRLTLPYWLNGQVRYVIGRYVEGHTADNEHERNHKYKKLLTHKEKHEYVSMHIANNVLFNEDSLRKRIDELVITEGVTDCIALKQHGFNTVSPVTTHFSDTEKQKLTKMVDLVKRTKIILCNDNDPKPDGKNPGQDASVRTGKFLYELGLDVWIATLPLPEGSSKIDVCDYLRDHGRDAMRKVLDEAKKYLDFLIDRVPANAEPEEKSRLLEPLVEAVSTRPPIERDAHLKRISDRFKIKLSTLEKMALVAEVEDKKEEAAKKEEPKKKAANGDARLRGKVYEELDETGCYYTTRTKDGLSEQISSFTLTPRQRLLIAGKEHIQADIVTTSGKTISNFIFPSDVWGSRRRFVDCFPSMDMMFTGGDEHVHGVRKIISDIPVPLRLTTQEIGYVASEAGPRWVWPGGVIDANGFQADPDFVCLVNGSENIYRSLDYSDTGIDEAKSLGKDVLPLLLQVNRPEVILPTLSWFFASAFKPRIMQLLQCFPILMIWGTAGSGKTTLVRDIFWPLFGIARGTKPHVCTLTDFATLLNLCKSSSIPTILDEFKPTELKPERVDQIRKYVRYAYGGQTEERGRRDQGVNSYTITSPLCIVGESMLEGEASLAERVLFVSTNKDTIRSDPRAKEAFEKLRILPLSKLAAPYIQWSLNQTIDVTLLGSLRLEALKIVQAIGARAPDERIVSNLTVFLFGLAMFDRWCEHLGIHMASMRSDVEASVRALLSEIGCLDGTGGTRDAFDHFVEALSIYGHEGAILTEGTHYAGIDGNICLHLASCYEVYRAERVRRRQDDLTNGVRSLRRIVLEKFASGSSYIVNPDKRVQLKGLPGARPGAHPFVRCVEINEELFPGIDFVPFRVTESRTHGGARHAAAAKTLS